MTLTIPEAFPNWLVEAVAGYWPESDEDAVRREGDHWSDSAESCRVLAKRHDVAAAAESAALNGSTADAKSTRNMQLGDDLRNQAAYADAMAEQCHKKANDVEFTKLQVIGTGFALLAQLAVDVWLAAPGVAKAAEDRAAAESSWAAAARKHHGKIKKVGLDCATRRRGLPLAKATAIGFALGAGTAAAVNAGAQFYQMEVTHHRDKMEWDLVQDAAIIGGVGGGVGARFAARVAPGINKFLGRAAARSDSNVVRYGAHITSGVLIGGVGGVTGALGGLVASIPVTGHIPKGDELRTTVLHGFVGGFVGSASIFARPLPPRATPTNTTTPNSASATPPSTAPVIGTRPHPDTPLLGMPDDQPTAGPPRATPPAARPAVPPAEPPNAAPPDVPPANTTRPPTAAPPPGGTGPHTVAPRVPTAPDGTAPPGTTTPRPGPGRDGTDTGSGGSTRDKPTGTERRGSQGDERTRPPGRPQREGDTADAPTGETEPAAPHQRTPPDTHETTDLVDPPDSRTPPEWTPLSDHSDEMVDPPLWATRVTVADAEGNPLTANANDPPPAVRAVAADEILPTVEPQGDPPFAGHPDDQPASRTGEPGNEPRSPLGHRPPEETDPLPDLPQPEREQSMGLPPDLRDRVFQIIGEDPFHDARIILDAKEKFPGVFDRPRTLEELYQALGPVPFEDLVLIRNASYFQRIDEPPYFRKTEEPPDLSRENLEGFIQRAWDDRYKLLDDTDFYSFGGVHSDATFIFDALHSAREHGMIYAEFRETVRQNLPSAADES
ncbi:hypothetical protein OIE68_19960 [Nocardia vinacea]|uniref:WXG100-like domain-containing protein n=1 Tax=Nocardia vinacea TaxID=96468 RepID=UPI002E15D05B|nr:hypothetical protein OIE68_19960 [Nocardia vinacea]